MPSEAATAIAYVAAFVGLMGGGVALFNSWKAVQWKRAELANSYLKDFNNNTELVIAGRCLDWNGGKLVLPETLRPYMPDGSHFIHHDRRVFAKAMRPDLSISELDEEPRIQLLSPPSPTSPPQSLTIPMSQKLSFKPNWMTRGSPAEVIEPKPVEPSTTFGVPSGGVFVRLKTSVRNSRLRVSPM